MVLPVARLARERGLAEPVILALTTAAAPAREAGFRTVGFADFVRASDSEALATGSRLVDTLLTAPVNVCESEAYLGLSYADLEQRHGTAEAARRYAQAGRQSFEPVGVLERIIGQLRPALVVATSAPRAEKAAILAAGRLGVPVACLVDLFAVDEVAWIGRPGFANRVCVLNEAVRGHLLAAGRGPQEVVATGNPAFDRLALPEAAARGAELRRDQGWESAKVVVWASQPEPSSHPSVPGRTGDPSLPGRIERALLRWTAGAPQRVLVVRRHPSEGEPAAVPIPGVRWDGRQFELHSLLHAADVLVTMNSTVGVEAHLAGRAVIQVLGSLFDESVPLARFGMATACAGPEGLEHLLDECVVPVPAQHKADAVPGAAGRAAEAVLAVLKEL
jgi:hypothetical protein